MPGSGEQVVQVGGRRLRITSLDKVMYPEAGTTKGDVIGYYAEIAPVMLPYVAGRPCTRKRWVDGVGTADAPGGTFFAKDLGQGTPDWVRRARIPHSDHDHTYPVVDDLPTLVWLAQLAALELHVPQWRFDAAGTPQHPDRLVLDLDPGEGVGLGGCAEVAFLVREILDGMGLASVPVTSGSKGIHLYAPLDGTLSSDQASALARELARSLEADHPKLVVSSMSKSVRPGRVFLDWSQNNGKKTTIAPYSLRGRFRPTVAAPRTWEELADPDLCHLEYGEVLALVAERGDPMEPLRQGHVGASPGEFMATVADAAAQGASDRLGRYREKRSADRTPEPVPAAGAAPPAPGDLPRFVIQHHFASREHYDFRLEHEGVLVSWAVPKGLPEESGRNHLAVMTEDHPLEYATFEGTIPKGEYGAGRVDLWDTGVYDLEKWRDDEVIVTLHTDRGGPAGDGRFALIRTDGSGEKSTWLLHRMKRPAVRTRRPPRPEPVPAEAERPFTWQPMLAATAKPHDLAHGEWVAEMKWDGMRALVEVDGERLRMFTRNGIEVSARYPELEGLPARLAAGSAVLDGEVVALDATGRPDFGRMQQRMHLTAPREIRRGASEVPVRLLLFDVLSVDGESVVDRPYRERRDLLERLVPPAAGSPVQVPPAFEGDVVAAIEQSRALGLEGVVAKDADSRYRPGARSTDWLKVKHERVQSVVIGGWRPGKGMRDDTFGSLLIGIPGDGGLRYAGRVGTGFTDAQLARIAGLLESLRRTDSPFVEVPPAEASDAVWVEPRLVGEIAFGEWTPTGVARHPTWRGLRPDVDPADVAEES